MKNIIAFAILIILFSPINLYAHLNKNLINESILIAEKTAKKLGYKTSRMGMMLQENELPMHLYYDENDQKVKSGPKYELLKRLDGKNYISIYFRPYHKNPGKGDITIIIDENDGKTVLGIYEGSTKKLTKF